MGGSDLAVKLSELALQISHLWQRHFAPFFSLLSCCKYLLQHINLLKKVFSPIGQGHEFRHSLTRSEKLMHLIIRLTEVLGRLKGSKAKRWIVTLLDAPLTTPLTVLASLQLKLAMGFGLNFVAVLLER